MRTKLLLVSLGIGGKADWWQARSMDDPAARDLRVAATLSRASLCIPETVNTGRLSTCLAADAGVDPATINSCA
jgi:hypothetical protein